MVPGIGPVAHGPCDRITHHIAVKTRQVAQILECLGIAFTHYIGTGVAVKYPDQLPRIPVIYIPGNRAGIVGDESADLLAVASKLLLVGLCCVLIFKGSAVYALLPRYSFATVIEKVTD